jgi:hypothetical protein
MRKLQLRLAVLTAPVLTLAVVLAGCGGDKGKDKGDGSGDKNASSTDSGGRGTGGPKTAVEGKGRGTLKGQIVYDGTPPDMTKPDATILAAMTAKDEKHCVTSAPADQKKAFEWIVHPQSKGVKNVIVWLSPGDNAYFKLSDADKKPSRDKVEIRQPHCAFIPHCDVAFTCYTDGSKLAPTGQKIVFKNDAETVHNTNYSGDRIKGDNPLIQPGKEYTAEDINKPDLIRLSCSIHTWMRAYIRNFDHPFAAVTDENGNYEIKNVPTGVPVHLVIWHGAAEYGANGPKGKPVTLKDGDDNTENLTIKAK